MKRFKIQWDDNCIDWDKDYGINLKKGWSVCIKGHYIIQFERFLIIAILKAIKDWLQQPKNLNLIKIKCQSERRKND